MDFFPHLLSNTSNISHTFQSLHSGVANTTVSRPRNKVDMCNIFLYKIQEKLSLWLNCRLYSAVPPDHRECMRAYLCCPKKAKVCSLQALFRFSSLFLPISPTSLALVTRVQVSASIYLICLDSTNKIMQVFFFMHLTYFTYSTVL